MKRRHEFYLDEDVSEQLESLASKPGTSKTAVMSAALRAFLERRATNELDDRFRIRLDRISNDLARIARDQQIVAESVAALVRVYLRSALALAPDNTDREAERQVRYEFDRFLKGVSRNVANGQGLISDVLEVTRQMATRQ